MLQGPREALSGWLGNERERGLETGVQGTWGPREGMAGKEASCWLWLQAVGTWDGVLQGRGWPGRCNAGGYGGRGELRTEPERRKPAPRTPRVRGALGSPPGVREGSRGVQGEARGGRGWKTRGAPASSDSRAEQGGVTRTLGVPAGPLHLAPSLLTHHLVPAGVEARSGLQQPLSRVRTRRDCDLSAPDNRKCHPPRRADVTTSLAPGHAPGEAANHSAQREIRGGADAPAFMSTSFQTRGCKARPAKQLLKAASL